MSSYAFVPLINRPTRVTATSATLIDNIFINNFENLENSFQGVLVTDISDHYPIFYINCDNKVIEIERFVERRIYNKTNKQAFFLWTGTYRLVSVVQLLRHPVLIWPIT